MTMNDNYLTHTQGIWSWLFTLDHKRIGVMYLMTILTAFLLGGIMALLVRTQLTYPSHPVAAQSVQATEQPQQLMSKQYTVIEKAHTWLAKSRSGVSIVWDEMVSTELAQQVQAVTQQHVEVAFVDQGYTGDQPEQAAAEQGIHLIVVKLPEAKKGFVWLPRRWVIERSFAWTARFRRLARDYERLPDTLKGLHFLAFAILMLVCALGVLSGTARAQVAKY